MYQDIKKHPEKSVGSFITTRIQKNRIYYAMAIALSISACGGGGSTSVTSTPATPPSPGDNSVLSSCAGLDLLNIAMAVEDGVNDPALGPENVIDDDLSAASRWQAQASGDSITLDLDGPRLVRDIGIAWYLGDQQTSSFSLSVSDDGETFTEILPTTDSSGATLSFERYNLPNTAANFVRISTNGTSQSTEAGVVEAAVFGCSLDPDPAPALAVAPFDPRVFGLDPNEPPGENFDLLTWSIDTPRDQNNNQRADRTSETALDNGFVDPDFFFTADDGGMVFLSTIEGAPTSLNTNFNRSELREMLRRGNTSISTQGANGNNWALGYQPVEEGINHGGRNGVLRATLAINQVTTTGSTQHVGRTIIGQIHAESDEPLRIYYKKFPNSDRGYIYMAHEIRESDDIWLTVLGPENPDIDDEPIIEGADPANGIALNELFSYEIIQAGARIDVILRRGDQDGEIIGHNYVDMIERNSGYDIANEWNYFRAGAYTQNNTGRDGVTSDFDRITFYRVENTHD